jgi:ankyrin repeat protein
MSDALPDRPDLEQLRRRAKELRDAARLGDAEALERFARHHPSPGPGAPSLAAAQLVIARELGFRSWPGLKAAVDAGTASRRTLSSFLAASVEGHLTQAGRLLLADPDVARADLRAASVLGEVARVREMLAVDPGAAVAIDDERGWPPLLYACYSRWHQTEPARAAAIAQVVGLLVEAGASANTNDGGRSRFRSALKGSVEVDNPDVTEVLLDAGASPDLGQPIGEAPGHRDDRCLRLLLSHGARVAGTWALGSAVYNDDPVAVSLILEALRAAGASVADQANESLLEAVTDASLPVVAALLDAGADPDATDDEGMSALRHAVRAGKNDIAERLRAQGAADNSTEIDRFIGACLNGDRGAAERLLADHPDLRERLSDEDRATSFDAAASRSAAAVALMLDVGFSPHTRADFGDQPLHTASYSGNAAAVRLLLEAGAEVDALDTRFEATPLCFATVGSGEQAGKPGNWTETVRLLIEAGASRQDVWVTDKPPSEEVMDLLRSYGINPDEPDAAAEEREDEQPEEQETEVPGSIGTGVMAEIARHLDDAYRNLDLDLLGSLLHPEVHWAQCHSSGEVLDWYRSFLADGTTPTVRSVEVDGDAVLLGLALTRPAEGARPAPPQLLYQVFTIVDAQIAGIRGYPDRRSALARE